LLAGAPGIGTEELREFGHPQKKQRTMGVLVSSASIDEADDLQRTGTTGGTAGDRTHRPS